MSLLHLFSLEAETQTALLNDGLLTLERDPQNADSLEALMRAAHSLKGAARIVQLSAAERLAHVMDDCFVAAQEGRIVLTSEHIEVLLQGVDMLTRLAQVAATASAAEELETFHTAHRARADEGGEPPHPNRGGWGRRLAAMPSPGAVPPPAAPPRQTAPSPPAPEASPVPNTPPVSAVRPAVSGPAQVESMPVQS